MDSCRKTWNLRRRSRRRGSSFWAQTLPPSACSPSSTPPALSPRPPRCTRAALTISTWEILPSSSVTERVQSSVAAPGRTPCRLLCPGTAHYSTTAVLGQRRPRAETSHQLSAVRLGHTQTVEPITGNQCPREGYDCKPPAWAQVPVLPGSDLLTSAQEAGTLADGIGCALSIGSYESAGLVLWNRWPTEDLSMFGAVRMVQPANMTPLCTERQ